MKRLFIIRHAKSSWKYSVSDLNRPLKKRGIINLGGPVQSVYKFAKRYDSKIKKTFSKGEFPKRTDMNLNKLKKIIRK